MPDPRDDRRNGPSDRDATGALRAAAERRRRLRMLGGSFAIVALIVAAVVGLGAFQRDPAEQGSTTTIAGRTIRGATETAALLRGLPQHGTTLGDPRAPVTILAVSDLKCPHCQRHALTTQRELVDRLVRSGRARLTLELVNQRDAARGTTDGERARRAAYSVVGRNRFWSFVQTGFWNQGPTDREWATEPFLRAIATAAPGVDPADLTFDPDPASRPGIAAADRLARRLGTDETPSIYVAARGSRALRRVTAIDDVDAIARRSRRPHREDADPPSGTRCSGPRGVRRRRSRVGHGTPPPGPGSSPAGTHEGPQTQPETYAAPQPVDTPINGCSTVYTSSLCALAPRR